MMFNNVVIPAAVHRELSHAGASDVVREWALHLPEWIVIDQTPVSRDFEPDLDDGERAVIRIGALHRREALLIMDDWHGRQIAQRRSLGVIGTLGVLRDASRDGLVNFADAIDRLRHTNFTMSEELVARLLNQTTPGR